MSLKHLAAFNYGPFSWSGIFNDFYRHLWSWLHSKLTSTEAIDNPQCQHAEGHETQDFGRIWINVRLVHNVVFRAETRKCTSNAETYATPPLGFLIVSVEDAFVYGYVPAYVHIDEPHTHKSLSRGTYLERVHRRKYHSIARFLIALSLGSLLEAESVLEGFTVVLGQYEGCVHNLRVASRLDKIVKRVVQSVRAHVAYPFYFRRS
ncbi:hypothetical protein GGR57DRAFT_297377 [Xylariaceae sp. FL1272]|nr:hypothetical protein GGR57DRAFT_297377 [Xylariaceae sp. FL1272]